MDEATARAMIEAHFEARERIYFGDAWEPAWHAQWVERFDSRERDPSG